MLIFRKGYKRIYFSPNKYVRIFPNGDKMYFIRKYDQSVNYKVASLYRNVGPAEIKGKTKYWACRKAKFRKDGPAIIHSDNSKLWSYIMTDVEPRKYFISEECYWNS